MSKLVPILSTSSLGRSLRNGTRDIASDWKHWSPVERVLVILAVFLLLLIPTLFGRAL
jgi:hypothetical protein